MNRKTKSAESNRKVTNELLPVARAKFRKVTNELLPVARAKFRKVTNELLPVARAKFRKVTNELLPVARAKFSSARTDFSTLRQTRYFAWQRVCRKYFVGCLVAAACLGSCSKYSELKPQPQASYLRVFNSLNYAQGTAGLPPNEMTLLLDPVMDKNGLPVDAAVVGDYITERDLFSSSYPANAGNIAVTKQSEWPGSLPVLTAPAINGLDLSAWAQVPSGKHRILLMGRPSADTPFNHLPASARASVIADTSVTFTPGEVYTMEAVVFDFATSRTGAYMRNENFTRTPFSTQQNYLSFYCLTAANMSPNGGNGAFDPPLYLYYSLWSPICSNTGYTGITRYSCVWPAPLVNHVYFRTVPNAFGSTAPYDSLPMPPLSDFLNPDNSFVDSNYRPFQEFDIADGRTGSSPLYLGVSPDLGGYAFPASGFTFPQGLAIAASNSQQIRVYPSVNIIELVNGTAYLMQLHRTFDPPIITN